MDTEKIFRRLGLGKHESEVYIALLEGGPLTIAAIAKKAHIERPLVYAVIPDLLEQGLIMKVPKGKRYFYSARSPQVLSQLHSAAGEELARSLPSLEARFIKTEKRPEVTYLEGREGIISVYEDILNTLPHGGVFYRYSSSTSDRKKIYVPKNYSGRRDAKRIERYVITNKFTAAKKKKKLELSVKALPVGADLFEYNITQLIYGPKIAFVDYNSETAVVIENRVIAQFQERLFKLFYQRL